MSAVRLEPAAGRGSALCSSAGERPKESPDASKASPASPRPRPVQKVNSPRKRVSTTSVVLRRLPSREYIRGLENKYVSLLENDIFTCQVVRFWRHELSGFSGLPDAAARKTI